MEDNALNKDHSTTTSMPNNMAELGTGNFDQELTLRVLGGEEHTLEQIDAAIGASKTATTGCATSAVRRSLTRVSTPSLMRHSAYNALRDRKKTTGVDLPPAVDIFIRSGGMVKTRRLPQQIGVLQLRHAKGGAKAERLGLPQNDALEWLPQPPEIGCCTAKTEVRCKTPPVGSDETRQSGHS